VLIPLASATWYRWPVHRLIGLITLCLVLASGLLAVLTSRSLRLSKAAEDGFHDTYYVVVHGQWIATCAALFGLLFTLHWAANRWARPMWTRISIVALWCLTLGLIGPPVLRWALFAPPQRYVDYEAWAVSLMTLDHMSILVTGASTLALLVIPIHALIFHRQ